MTHFVQSQKVLMVLKALMAQNRWIGGGMMPHKNYNKTY